MYFLRTIINFKKFTPFNFHGYLGQQPAIFEFLNINKSLFYRVIIIYSCIGGLLFSFIKIINYSTVGNIQYFKGINI